MSPRRSEQLDDEKDAAYTAVCPAGHEHEVPLATRGVICPTCSRPIEHFIDNMEPDAEPIRMDDL